MLGADARESNQHANGSNAVIAHPKEARKPHVRKKNSRCRCSAANSNGACGVRSDPCEIDAMVLTTMRWNVTKKNKAHNKRMSKRDACYQLAKEDCRRFQSDETALSVLIKELSNDDQELNDAAKVLNKRAAGKPLSHMRTVDAWMRRATGIKLTTLQHIVDRFASHDGDVIDVTSSSHRKVSDVVMENCDNDSSRAEDPVLDDKLSTISCDQTSTLSISNVRRLNESALFPTDGASTVSKRPTDGASTVSKRAGSTIMAYDAQVTQLTKNVASEVSLADVKLERDTEESINQWYHKALSNLETQQSSNELRHEQFKRRRALLRVEYWAKLDKVRNNATPTVIG